MSNGYRVGPLLTNVSSVLERNRLVVLDTATLIASYAGIGSEPVGYLGVRSSASKAAINLLAAFEGTFLLTIGNSCAMGASLVGVSDGKVRAADYTVIDSVTASAPVDALAKAIYRVPAAGWSSAHKNSIAIMGPLDWSYVDMDTDTKDTVIYDTASKTFYVWDGTAWVSGKFVCYAKEAAVAGDSVECFLTKPVVTSVNFSEVVLCGLSTAEADDDNSVVVSNTAILATDIAFAVVKASTAAVYVTKAVVAAGSLTVTLSGDGGAGTVIQYVIIRPNV